MSAILGSQKIPMAIAAIPVCFTHLKSHGTTPQRYAITEGCIYPFAPARMFPQEPFVHAGTASRCQDGDGQRAFAFLDGSIRQDATPLPMPRAHVTRGSATRSHCIAAPELKFVSQYADRDTIWAKRDDVRRRSVWGAPAAATTAACRMRGASQVHWPLSRKQRSCLRVQELWHSGLAMGSGMVEGIGETQAASALYATGWRWKYRRVRHTLALQRVTRVLAMQPLNQTQCAGGRLREDRPLRVALSSRTGHPLL